MAPIAVADNFLSTTSNTMSSQNVAIYIVNPNSSSIITDALSTTLSPLAPPGCTLHFVTGPPTAPASIQTPAESILSASETFHSLQPLTHHPASAFLVACFSDHPLVPMLRSSSSKPAMHLLEAAILHSLSAGTKFGILTTGKSVVPDVESGVRRVLGGNSDRYVGTHATGLGVVELQSGNKDKVEGKVKEGARELWRKGADVIILGCAGMVGMEELVRRACREVQGKGEEGVAVVDGAKAGLQILAGLARVNYRG